MTDTAVSPQIAKYGEGMCVAMIENNGYHDSDFSGIFAVATADGYRFEHVTTGSTRCAGGFIPHEDATDEVLAAYRARRAKVLGDLAADRAKREAKVPNVGRQVTIVNPLTRGKNATDAGVTGEVVYRDVNAYDSRWAQANGHRTYRVGVLLADGRKVFLAEDRVRVTGHEDEDLPVNMGMVDGVIAASWPAR